MRERKNPRKFIIATGATLAALLMAACSDSPTSPTALTAARHALLSDTTVMVGDTTVATLVVDPTKGKSVIISGDHKIVIPANAICAVATSSYGPTEWDQPCATETQTVVITARSWYDAAGHPRVDFQPAMRFNPAAQAVVLYLNDHSATTSGLRIDYCADGALTCVDESVADSSLLTYRNGTNGLWYRRIKHFSGYNIASGYSSTEMQ
jgi:hypothetical protein